MPEQIGVSGCRLSDGRLHFGHYNGCFNASKLALVNENFFVIQGITHLAESKLDLLLSQIYAIDSSATTIACSQSDIFPSYAKLFEAACEWITVQSLETTNPKKDLMKSKEAMQLSQYMFPLHQAVQFLAFKANYVLMNDDNMRFVSLARRLLRRITSSYPNFSISPPTLLLGSVSRLPSFDGKKMAKANDNCIYLLTEQARLREQIRQYARFLGWRHSSPNQWEYTGRDDATVLPESAPLILACRAFSTLNICAPYRLLDVPDLIAGLEGKLLDIAENVSRKSAALLGNGKALQARKERDRKTAKAAIERNLAFLETGL